MKKALLIGLFLFPSLCFAQSDTDIQSSILQTLLTQFVAQVNAIDTIQGEIAQSSNPAQFANLTSVIDTQLQYTTQSISVLLNPTAAATVTAPTTNSVNFASTPQETQEAPDKSAILVNPTYTPSTPQRGVSDNIPYGQYGFDVSVLDSNGNYTKGAAVTMTSDLGPDTEYTNDLDYGGLTKYDRGFDYIPLTLGVKTLVFTSGNLSQTIQLTVASSTN